jgi:hypothetical protein
MVAHRSGNVQAIRDAAVKIRSGEIEDLSQLNFSDLVHIEELAIDDVEPLRSELDAFVDSVVHDKPAVISAADGLANVELATRIVQAIPHHSL